MISNGWQSVPLGEVLTRSAEMIEIVPTERYTQVTVRLWGKGVVPRGEVGGLEVASGRRFLVRKGQFILSRIDARHGAFGIVPGELDGAIATNDFPTFEVNEKSASRSFLSWLSRTQDFVQLCRRASEGTTNRVRLKESRFLDMPIPLPDRKEQDRIVVKLDALSARIDEARECYRQIEQEGEALCRSLIHSATSSKPVEMSNLVRLRPPDVEVKPDAAYEFAGVYCFGRGVFKGSTKTGMEFSYPKLTRLREGDFVYPKLMAWEGALAVVPPECDGLVVSTEFPVFEIDTDMVLPEVLDVYFRSPEVWPQLSGTSTGTNVRRRRLKPASFLKFRLPLPSRQIQFQLREIKMRMVAMRKDAEAIITELDALLPSALDKAFKGEL